MATANCDIDGCAKASSLLTVHQVALVLNDAELVVVTPWFVLTAAALCHHMYML
jgi:hypothetical protein